MENTDTTDTTDLPINQWQLLRVKLRSAGFVSGLMIVFGILQILLIGLSIKWIGIDSYSDRSTLHLDTMSITALLAFLASALLLLIPGIRLKKHRSLKDEPVPVQHRVFFNIGLFFVVILACGITVSIMREVSMSFTQDFIVLSRVCMGVIHFLIIAAAFSGGYISGLVGPFAYSVGTAIFFSNSFLIYSIYFYMFFYFLNSVSISLIPYLISNKGGKIRLLIGLLCGCFLYMLISAGCSIALAESQIAKSIGVSNDYSLSLFFNCILNAIIPSVIFVIYLLFIALFTRKSQHKDPEPRIGILI